MDIKIYQINLERDTNNVAFMGHPETVKFQKSDRIDGSIYDLVYEGDVPCTTLEDIYQMFNINHPTDFTGHSLSISDVVQIKEGANNAPAFYFCDRIGFEKIHFDPELTQDARPKTIDVVLVEPGMQARQARIPANLEGMQATVKGSIEAFYPFEEQVCIVCNEEGKITDLPLNRAVYSEPEEVDMTYHELCAKFRQAERQGRHISGYIVFTEDSWPDKYPVEGRTYEVSSNNKAFQAGMGGYSIYGGSIDGTDPCVRLERYMADEKGGKDGWKIERCYTKEREMVDIIAGTFFVCDCSGENFGSLNEDQLKTYTEMFKQPERFAHFNGEIVAFSYSPSKSQER